MRVEVKNLHRYFGQTKAVNGISFEFESGQVFGFIGPNGAGKTTTIKIISTLDEPLQGDVLFDGMSAVEYPDKVRRYLGYMPDALPEHHDIKVWEYLDFFARAYNISGEERLQTLRELEEFTGLTSMLNKTLKSLSKGMKQRVSLARALVHNPKVLVMDEPAAGLDPRARMELRELLKILAGQGKAILISSHILAELEDICTGAVIIEKGRILGAGRIEQLNNGLEAQQKSTVIVRFLGEPAAVLRQVLEVPFVDNAKLTGGNRLVAEIDGMDEECASCLTTLIEKKCRIIEFSRQTVGLEELFMQITKGEVQ